MVSYTWLFWIREILGRGFGLIFCCDIAFMGFWFVRDLRYCGFFEVVFFLFIEGGFWAGVCGRYEEELVVLVVRMLMVIVRFFFF